MPVKRAPFLTNPYSGYFHRNIPDDERDLTRVGPGTPAGEYLRRFWQPILLRHQLKDVPVAVKRFDEELVIFRDESGRIGLIEAHCAHRGTSLEYGNIEHRGIRCCYHSCLIDVDGTILETPGDPDRSTFKHQLYHGAYPTVDYNGIIFAYLGHPEKMPPFPSFDILEKPGYRLEPGIHLMPTDEGPIPNHKPCNWLQIVDNLLDPIHEEFLHATISGLQFMDKNGKLVEQLAINGTVGFLETPTGIITLDVRRVDRDTVWVRNIEFIWPNIGVLGSVPVFPHEWGPIEKEFHDVPNSLIWIVPVDDFNSIEIDFVRVPEGNTIPTSRQFSPSGKANRGGRPYDVMQRVPGDYEAMIGQRPIAIHALEHLGSEDRGVTLMRKHLRKRVRMVKAGQDPPELNYLAASINTFGGDTLLKISEARSHQADNKLLERAGLKLAKLYVENPPNCD